MNKLDSVSRPAHRMPGAMSVKRLKSSQGAVRCLLAVFVSDDACGKSVSAARVLCMACRTRLLAASVGTLVFDDGRQRVDVELNEATDIDVLERVVRGV